MIGKSDPGKIKIYFATEMNLRVWWACTLKQPWMPWANPASLSTGVFIFIAPSYIKHPCSGGISRLCRLHFESAKS